MFVCILFITKLSYKGGTREIFFESRLDQVDFIYFFFGGEVVEEGSGSNWLNFLSISEFPR